MFLDLGFLNLYYMCSRLHFIMLVFSSVLFLHTINDHLLFVDVTLLVNYFVLYRSV